MNHDMWPRQSLKSVCCVGLCYDAGGRCCYLVSLWDGVLQLARSGLHAVGVVHSLSWRWSRSQDSVLEGLCSSSQAPLLLLLLGRKNCFLILQSPLHYELILERAERPEEKEHNRACLPMTCCCQIPWIINLLIWCQWSTRGRNLLSHFNKDWGMHMAAIEADTEQSDLTASWARPPHFNWVDADLTLASKRGLWYSCFVNTKGRCAHKRCMDQPHISQCTLQQRPATQTRLKECSKKNKSLST